MRKSKILNPKRELVNVVAIIPARGGEQSIHYKNLQKLGGKTLLAWAIEVAMNTDKVDAVLVSTEDKRIAGEAEKWGAIVIPRPEELSLPNSGDAGWYHHAVTWMESIKGWTPELLDQRNGYSVSRYSVCLQIRAVLLFEQFEPFAKDQSTRRTYG